jgi:epoxyqueuosine reductase QueG
MASSLKKGWLESEELRARIAAYLTEVVEAEGAACATRFGEPLAGFVAAADPRLGKLKEVAHREHFLPEELLPGAKTVVVYFLPFPRAVVMENGSGTPTTRAWAVAYKEANALLGLMGEKLLTMLEIHGVKGAGVKPTHNFNEETLLANWSHRHLAWLAGLGEFGLNRMLITKKGCAGRYGSLVIDVELVEQPEQTTSICWNKGGHPCLYFSNGGCQVCVKNCPSGALTVDGFDRHKCYAYMLDHCQDRFADLGVKDVCGKCLTTPCAHQ